MALTPCGPSLLLIVDVKFALKGEFPEAINDGSVCRG